MSSRIPTGLLAAPVAAALLLGACSSGSSSTAPLTVSYKDAANATRTAGPAKTTGTATGPKGASGPVKGAFEGDLTGAGLVSASLFTATNRADIELLWHDKTIYVKRAETADATLLSRAGTQSWMLHSPNQRAWSKRSVESQFTAELFSPFAPAALADLLATRKVPVEVTHDGSQRKMHAKNPLAFLGAWQQVNVDLWVNDDNRITRVTLTSETGGMSYDVKYGGSAPSVEAPPPNQIDTPVPTTPKPAGPFVTVSTGNSNGVAWTLERAPGTQGYECWRWHSTPPIAIVAADAQGTRCVPSADPTDDPADQAAFVASSNGQGKYDVLALRLPANTRSVGVSPIGGQATITPTSGNVFVWVAPATDKAGSAFVLLKDGTRLPCGPGWISSPADWKTAAPGDRAKILAEPWVCTSPF